MRRPPAAPPPAATLRLYCHGLGDCTLLTLPAQGRPPFRILIDCGIHSAARAGNARLGAVVDDLAEASGGEIDVIVGTHEHWDHLSGFLVHRDRFVHRAAPGLGKNDPRIRVGEVWLAWTEDPSDPDARDLDRYKREAEAAIMGMRLAMEGAFGMEDAARGVDSLLGFLFGAGGERVRSAREALRTLAPVRYLEPGTRAPLPPEVGGVDAFVLGPPRDRALLHLHDDPTDAYRLALGAHPDVFPMATALAVNEGRLEPTADPASPFDSTESVPLKVLLAAPESGPPALARLIRDHYLHPEEGPQAHRRIDSVWLGAAPELALQLDRNTNNTSLVLAFELEAAAGVLLFAADAQAGNWKSWHSLSVPLAEGPDAPRRTTAELLARTIFYKVGHHGSGNATLREAGLLRMDRSRLVAFNPTDAELAARLRWRNFPAQKLTEALIETACGRYIASDAEWIGNGLSAPVPLSGALRALRHGRRAVPGGEGHIGWVEIDLG